MVLLAFIYLLSIGTYSQILWCNNRLVSNAPLNVGSTSSVDSSVDSLSQCVNLLRLSFTWNGDVLTDTSTCTCHLYQTRFGFPSEGFDTASDQYGKFDIICLEYREDTTYLEKPIDTAIKDELCLQLIRNTFQLNDKTFHDVDFVFNEAQHSGAAIYIKNKFEIQFTRENVGFYNNSAGEIDTDLQSWPNKYTLSSTQKEICLGCNVSINLNATNLFGDWGPPHEFTEYLFIASDEFSVDEDSNIIDFAEWIGIKTFQCKEIYYGFIIIIVKISIDITNTMVLYIKGVVSDANDQSLNVMDEKFADINLSEANQSIYCFDEILNDNNKCKDSYYNDKFIQYIIKKCNESMVTVNVNIVFSRSDELKQDIYDENVHGFESGIAFRVGLNMKNLHIFRLLNEAIIIYGNTILFWFVSCIYEYMQQKSVYDNGNPTMH